VHLADQSLHSLAAPDLESALQCAKMPVVVSVGIPCPEVYQELQRGLIGIGLQTLKHFCPMRLEGVGTPAGPRLRVPVSALSDHYTARAGIVAPESDTTDKGV
jgi:hypothetical protein